MSEIGIPEKGRNAGIALEQELDIGAGFVVDLLNGEGKRAAKTGENLGPVRSMVDHVGFVEMRDTGRAYPRPVFTEISMEEQDLVGGANDFGDSEVVYVGIDRAAERYLDEIEIEEGEALKDYVEDIAGSEGYSLEQLYSDEKDRWVKWGLMNNSLEEDISKLLYPEEFENLGQAAAQRICIEPVLQTYSDYSEQNGMDLTDEEELIYRAPKDVAGLYMWVTGKTADEVGEEGLEKRQVEGFQSKLGKFREVKS